MKSVQEQLFLGKSIGSLITWWKPFDVLNEKSCVPSNQSMSPDYQVVYLALKPPNMTETDGYGC